MINSNENKPIPAVMWGIVDVCNYRCEYCVEKQYDKTLPRKGLANESTINAVLKLLLELPGSWQIVFGTGESTIHPRFLQICDEIKKSRHKIRLTTNFSSSYEKLLKLVEICGNKLEFVTASLHLSQINLEEFIKKAIWFNSIKNHSTQFLVTPVMIENNFLQLKQIKERFDKEEILFQFQLLRINGKVVQYPEYIEEYISGCLIKNAKTLKDRVFFGTKCLTGDLFFVIESNGDAYRCFETQPGGYLGNIVKGTFKRNNGPKPCLALKCTCEGIPNRNLILFNKKENPIKLAGYIIKSLGNDKDFKKRLLNKSKNVLKKPFVNNIPKE